MKIKFLTTLFALLVMICCCGAGPLCPRTYAPQYTYYSNPVVYGYPYYNAYTYNYSYQYAYPVIVPQSYTLPLYYERTEYRPAVGQFFMNYSHYYYNPVYYNNHYFYNNWYRYNY